jgi:hypothetical protein
MAFFKHQTKKKKKVLWEKFTHTGRWVLLSIVARDYNTDIKNGFISL